METLSQRFSTGRKEDRRLHVTLKKKPQPNTLKMTPLLLVLWAERCSREPGRTLTTRTFIQEQQRETAGFDRAEGERSL